MELEGVAELFEQKGGTEDESLSSSPKVGVNPVKSIGDHILAWPYTGSDPISSSLNPSKIPHADDQFSSFSPSGVQNSFDFSGDKGVCSSQGDGLLPIQEPNPSLNLHDVAIGNKVKENVEATSCHEMVQNNLCSHPLIQELGVKVVNPIGISSPLVDSPTTYTRKEKRLIKELGRLASNINYGGKVSRQVGKAIDEDSSLERKRIR